MMNDLLRRLSGEGWIAGGVSLASFLLYCTTLAPGIMFIDAGELAAVCSVLGIAHPTGYPVFTLMGRVVTMLPVAGEPIGRLNLLSAALVGAANGVLYLMLRRLQSASALVSSRRSQSPSPLWMGRAAAAVAVLTVGFTPTVWMQATAVEVYALHYLALCLMLLMFARGLEEQQGNPAALSRWLLLAAYVTGLSFANHMTTLLVIPGVLLLAIWSLEARRSLHVAVRVTPAFLLGVSTYTYLVIRSSSGPPLDWGHPAELERLWWHVSGKQYRSWIFSGFESASRQFGQFVERLPEEYTWVVLAVAVLGVLGGLWRRPRLVVFSIVLWAATVFYAVNYDIHDIESYFLLTYIATALLVYEGVLMILRGARDALLPWMYHSVVVLVLLAPAAMALHQRAGVDQSDAALPEYYARGVLNALDSGAVVLTYQWDDFVSPVLYLQHVAGLRPDVTVIDKELLRRSWYFIQLERAAPWLVRQCRAPIDAFLEELYRFEHDLPYDGAVIEARFNAMINALIDEAARIRPVYVGPEIEPRFGSSYERIPEVLLFRLRRGGEPAGTDSPALGPPSRSKGSRMEERLRTRCAEMLTNRAVFELHRGRSEEARRYLALALAWRPSFYAADQLLRSVGAGN